MSKKDATNDVEASGKSRPKRRRILVAIAGIMLFGCIGLLAFGAYLNSTPEGKATATARAEATREGQTVVAVAQATEKARPTNTLMPTEIPIPTGTPVPTNTPSPTDTPAPTDTPIPSDTPNPNLIRPGTHIVGTDIQPGIYRGEAGTGLAGLCYWARLKNLSGALDAVLANCH